MKVTLVKTCDACPEQYDVYLDKVQIGYLRLRHGYFAARYPGVIGEEVYGCRTIGDGVFDPSERNFHLTEAVMHLVAVHAMSNIEYKIVDEMEWVNS